MRRRTARLLLVTLLLSLVPGMAGNVTGLDAVCPLYGHEFRAQILVQGERSISAFDSDLCKRPSGFQSPYIYAVWTCPYCFYSAYQGDFHGDPLGPEFRDMDLLTMSLDPSMARQDQILPGLKYTNAETFYKTSGRNARFLADLTLRGSYACRVTRLPEAPEYRALGREIVDEILQGKPRQSVERVSRAVIARIRERLEVERITKEKAEVYRYLMADSMRQAGDHVEAERIYTQLVATALLPDRYLSNARQKADLCRQEGVFQQKTLEHLAQAEDEGIVPDEEKALVVYLRGELSRRLGRHSEARKLFAEAAKLPAEPPWLSAMIEKQAGLIPSTALPAESGTH